MNLWYCEYLTVCVFDRFRNEWHNDVIYRGFIFPIYGGVYVL
jgi:hypothetical protein